MENNQRSSSNPHLAKPVLCDGFLIPMTDFVLRVNEIEKEIDQFFDSWRMKQLRIIENYAKFLKQPLKLEMFVPCVEGEPIQYVELKKTGGKICQVGSEIEKEAKEKVFFENITTDKNNKGFWLQINGIYIARFDTKEGLGFFKKVENIDDLSKIKNLRGIKLSQTALDSIFGKTGA